MTLDDMKAELEEDLKINLTSVQAAASDTASIYGKWVRYLADVKRDIIRADNNLKKVTSDRFNYYTGRSEDDVCLDHYDKSELKFVLAADPKVMEATTKLDLLNIMYDFCKSALDATKQKGYSIKAIVDMRNLESGK
ncbi:putative recombination, repair and single-stranded DNA binding protein [Cronobacter phage S13]|jgi:hypothetical protein|uniref:Recombination, repair and ssDNA binding protein n=1 Tax=Cronobacter phage LPCS28 TaxID=2924885 RepID=A0AAE9G4W7_9CAUD|nr:putative recombination, repair and single-stranded DNA binding protein [Cronobacter phage S13]YP_010665906.1 UvsY-like recombination mediator [Cronobacter phage LPCS28]AIA64854.1 putative recombination, repair and single-stranded DNA binding protein [Cronobacter phage S13]UNY47095.1 hypothetical protein EHEKIMEA_00213 [Cronobacter phage LPCS28]